MTCRWASRTNDPDGNLWMVCWLRPMAPTKAVRKKLPSCECYALLPPDALCGGWQRREDGPWRPQDGA